MSTIKSINSNSVKNVGGSGVNLGKTTSMMNNTLGQKGIPTGSVVVDGVDTDPAIASPAEFAYNNQLPIAMRFTTKLAGEDSNVLLSGASVPSLNVSVHKIESIITRRTSTSFRAGQFNLYTGQFTVAPSVVTDTFHKSVVGSEYVDSAANVSRSNAGNAVYLSGSKVPVSNRYGD